MERYAAVAPLRGRGLKLKETVLGGLYFRSRSLTGAWIETAVAFRRGDCDGVAPLRGRGLKQWPGLRSWH